MGVKFEPMTSRRALLKAGTGFAAGAAVVPLRPNAAVAQSQDSEAATLEHLLRADPNTRRILLKGGTIISMDPTVGDFAQGDVLIEGKKISAIGREEHHRLSRRRDGIRIARRRAFRMSRLARSGYFRPASNPNPVIPVPHFRIFKPESYFWAH